MPLKNFRPIPSLPEFRPFDRVAWERHIENGTISMMAVLGATACFAIYKAESHDNQPISNTEQPAYIKAPE